MYSKSGDWSILPEHTIEQTKLWMMNFNFSIDIFMDWYTSETAYKSETGQIWEDTNSYRNRKQVKKVDKHSIYFWHDET